jgi:hypothetical protein
MNTIQKKEVIFTEYDLTTRSRTEWYITTTDRTPHIGLVIMLWLEDHQKECIEGMAEGIITGI